MSTDFSHDREGIGSGALRFELGLEDRRWYLTTAPIILANWEASSGNEWTVPVGGGLGKVFPIGKQPVNLNLQAYYNVERPAPVGAWSSRIAVQFMFPK